MKKMTGEQMIRKTGEYEGRKTVEGLLAAGKQQKKNRE